MKPPPRLRGAGGERRQNGAVVSLPRTLSKLGFCSRTQAEVLITEGRVRIDSRVVRNVTARVDPAHARITVDGQPVVAERKVYLMLNKPRGLVTTRDDPHERATVYDCLEGLDLPFVATARCTPQVVCSLHAGFINGALAELGSSRRATALVPQFGEHHCVARLETVDVGRHDEAAQIPILVAGRVAPA